MNDENIYHPLIENFFRKDMSAAIHILEGMDEKSAAEVLQSLDPELGLRVLRNLQISYGASLLERFDNSFLSRLGPLLGSRFASALLMHLPPDARPRVIEHLSEKVREQIREILEYPAGSVGRIMTTDFLAFYKEITAEEAIETIRTMVRKRVPASYAYVVDEDDRLIGVLNMRDLMIASPDQALSTICKTEVFSLHCFTDRLEAAMELSKRKYFAAPIVDGDNHILGIIKAERMIQGVQEEVAGNIQRMFGAGGNERAFSPITFSLKKRLPWLHVNLATAFLAAAVVAMFEGIIAKFTILAVFLPVVAGQGGNAGAQSLAVVMRGLVMREIPREKVFSLIFKEGKLGAVSGMVIGIVTAIVAYLWQGNPFLGVVIGLGMIVNLICAGFSGAAIPLLMKRVGIDPAQSSSIILTTVTDVVGFIAFLGFAMIFQGYLG
ncbi:MAG: magnesium transporter [Desulfobacteraceae bacterium]